MARWKKPTKAEILKNRHMLNDRARSGGLILPQAVAEIRKSIGLTQSEFAKVTGLTQRQVAELEVGRANPTLETLEKIARLFSFSFGFVPRAVDEKNNVSDCPASALMGSNRLN